MKYVLIALSLTYSQVGAEPLSFENGNWNWSIGVGMGYTHLGQLKTRVTSTVRHTRYDSQFGDNLHIAPDIGGVSGTDERYYDDGFVALDGSTLADGYTSNWGYNSASQLDGQTLRFQARGYDRRLSADVSAHQEAEFSKDLDGLVPRIELQMTSKWEYHRMRFGFAAAVDFLHMGQSSHSRQNLLVQTMSSYDTVYRDTFSIQNIIPPLAPFAGNASGLGPLISNIPITREITNNLISSESVDFDESIDSSFSILGSTLSLGPTLQAQWKGFQIQWSTGVSMSMLRWKATQRERVLLVSDDETETYRELYHESGGNKIRWGVYSEFGVDYELPLNMRVKFYGRVDSMEALHFTNAETVHRLDGFGYSVGLGLATDF